MAANSSPIALMERYWKEWESKLSVLVQSKSAKLYFPAKLKQSDPDQEKNWYTVQPVTPICIYNAPPKGSSGKGIASSGRMAIFVTGSFELTPLERGFELHGATCEISFYRIKREDGDGVQLKLFDAMHFDYEKANNHTPFHPVFHAQRGRCRTITHESVKDLMVNYRVPGSEKVIVSDDEKIDLGTPYFRLPTPQLDIFSVFALLMADFFCNGGELKDNPRIQNMFRSILKHLTDERNAVREGASSRRLKDRFDSHISAAHWYAEFV
ncbi:MAG: hypothetical protein Q7V20_21660 [Aquabacterium sp.]|uniref:hypothetical protein n=1 Tax=Aquabacterium sp. TaxID=1872578 RepID=UPI00272632D3|nr:hypothetical protein [Aquabacterium sp.]MDO9006059.1 hypothetical protein [Aquabacterium sp.]